MTALPDASPAPRTPGGPLPAGPPPAPGVPTPPRDRLPLRRELARKAIHLSTIGLPVAVWFLPRPASLALLAAGVVAALAVEWARAEVRWARYLFLTRTRAMLRRHERKGLAGATYMAIAYLGAVLLFPRPVAVAAMLYNALGDSAAALVGKRWGRHRLPWGKSWEGTAAAFATNFAVGLLVPGFPPFAAAVGAAAAALVELAPLPIDDNLRVALLGGAALWAAVALA